MGGRRTGVNMNLPKKVQEQLERAEQLEQALRDPPAQPPEKQQETAEPPEPPAPTAQETPPQPPAPQPDDQLAQQYRTLQGKYNAEMTQMRNALTERDRVIDEMRAEMASIKAQMQRPPEQPQQAPAPVVDPKDAENFGSDLVDMVARTAGVVFGQQAGPFIQRFDAIAKRLQAVEEQVKGVGQQQGLTAEQLYYAQLGQLVPDWEAINADPGWLAWLTQVDPVYGEPRQAALDKAHAAMSAQRVAAVFNAYKASIAPPQKQQKTNDLGKQVAPPKGGATTPQAAEPRVWTKDQITRFYDQVRRGELTPADEARMEAEINAALAEGRVR